MPTPPRPEPESGSTVGDPKRDIDPPGGAPEVRTPGSPDSGYVDDPRRPAEDRVEVTKSIGNESQGGVD
jgi:hypothetical protein